MMIHKRVWGAVLFLAVAGVSTTGCGGDDEEERMLYKWSCNCRNACALFR